MKKIMFAVLGLVGLVVMMPAIRDLFDALTGAVEDTTGTFDPFVDLIFTGLPVWIFLGGLGVVIWLVYQRRRGGGG